MAHPLAPEAAPLPLEPVVVLGLVLSAALYVAGWRRLGRRGRGRARPAAWRAGCYAAGLAAVGLAVASPVAAYGERLFSAHMVQHLLLAVAAPALLWLGAPLVPVLWGLPGRMRRGLGRLLVARHPVGRGLRVLGRPGVASLLYLTNLALWHVPAFYDAAQGPALVHHLEHALLVATALAYWWPVIHPTGGRRPLGYGATLLYLVPPMLEGDVIGALLSFAQTPLYATYAALPGADLEAVVADQRAGGLVMWVGGGLFWLVPMSVVFFLVSRDGTVQTGAPAMPSRVLALAGAVTLLAAAAAGAEQGQRGAPSPEGRPPTVREAAPGVRDQALADRVFLELAASRSLRDARIVVTAREGTVTLEGSVPSEETRERARRLASRTAGVRDLRDRLRVEAPAPRDRAEEVDDRDLAGRVARALAAGTFPGSRVRQTWLFGFRVAGASGGPEIDVYADAGEITLTGQVAQARDLAEAVRAARTVAGVESVRADLAVTGGNGEEAAGPRPAPHPPSRPGAAEVGPDELRRYAHALDLMARSEPGIAVAAREGKPIDPLLLGRVPPREAEDAIRQAGLSAARFSAITKRVEADPSLKEGLKAIMERATP